MNLGDSQNEGYLFGGVPINKDYSILGSILGYPNFEKLPFKARPKLLRRHMKGKSTGIVESSYRGKVAWGLWTIP